MASPVVVVPRKTKTAFKLEAVYGTAPTDTASDAIIPELGTTLSGFSRDWQEDNSQTGSLDHFKPHDGGPAEPGVDLTMKVHGSGTHGTAPDIGQLLQTSFGIESLSTAGTIDVAPAPTTTAFDLATGTAPVGHVLEVELTTGNFYPVLVKTNVAGSITVWPPLPSAPVGGENVYAGVSYLLTSDDSLMKSGSHFEYFQNGEKCVHSGLKGNVIFTAAIRQPFMAQFVLQGTVAPDETPGAIGYTPAPVGFGEKYHTIRGVLFRAYYVAAVGSGATTEIVPLTFADGTTSQFQANGSDANGIDRLIVDVSGAGGWENQPLKNFTYSTQTGVVDAADAFSGAPAEGNTAYIEKVFCLNDTITFDVGHTVTRLDCQTSDSSWNGQQFTDRMPAIDWSQYFRDLTEYSLLKQADFVDMWYGVGPVGSRVYVNIPNLFRQEHEIDLGGEYGIISMTGGGYTNTVTGNDSMYINFNDHAV
jgi:hypothetical protein